MTWKDLKTFYITYYRDYVILINYLVSFGLIPKEMKCEKCQRIIKLDKNKVVFRCNRSYINSCRKKVNCSFYKSGLKNTFFSRSHLPLKTVMEIVTLFLLTGHPHMPLMLKETRASSKTVVDWLSFCREVCVDWCFGRNQKIGGVNTVVEIDEAKFGKRKYNRGRLIEGSWVFGGIERGTKNCFLVPVEDRTADTLLAIIKDRILPGTTIVSDCWKAYDCLGREGYRHFSVNHSVNFVDPGDNTVHTQNIERIWRDVRGGIPRYGRRKAHLVGYLAEFLFKAANKENLVEAFLEQVKVMYPGLS